MPAELDAELAARGYVHQARTSVQLAPVSPNDARIHIHQWLDPDPQWVKTFGQMAALSASNTTTAAQMLQRLTLPACFALASDGGEIAACALGVLQGAYLGIFDVITHPSRRRRGFARGIVTHLLNWAHARGATHAYLQVSADNHPALALYSQLGFVEHYQYWYRVRTLTR